MLETEARRLVRREVDSICKAESGVLPPTPYVVVEIIKRLKTMKPWEGLTASTPIGRALRQMVEEIVQKAPRLPRKSPTPEPPDDLDLCALPPLEVVQAVGARKHRHLREIPILKEAG
jgi:hypothetical protein